MHFLEEYKKIDEGQFLENYKDVQALKHSLLEIIELCIDIGTHIISTKALQRVESYAETFRILGSEKIISLELSTRLETMARFRNVLVHQYMDVDNIRILHFVQLELDDVNDFIAEILKYLKEQQGND